MTWRTVYNVVFWLAFTFTLVWVGVEAVHYLCD